MASSISLNIFFSGDHPYNKSKPPDSFYPLDPLKESEVYTLVDYFPRGSVVASAGIQVTEEDGRSIVSTAILRYYLLWIALQPFFQVT